MARLRLRAAGWMTSAAQIDDHSAETGAERYCIGEFLRCRISSDDALSTLLPNPDDINANAGILSRLSRSCTLEVLFTLLPQREVLERRENTRLDPTRQTWKRRYRNKQRSSHRTRSTSCIPAICILLSTISLWNHHFIRSHALPLQTQENLHNGEWCWKTWHLFILVVF